MKLSLKIITEKTNFQKKHGHKYQSIELNTFNINKAISFLIKRYYGQNVVINSYTLEKSPINHHNSDLFAIIDVEYLALGSETKYMIVTTNYKTGNTDDVPYKVPKTITVKQRIRVEVKLDKISEARMSKWQKFKQEWKFNRLYSERYS